MNILNVAPVDFSAGTLGALALILAISAVMSGLSGFGFSAIGALCLWLLPPKLGVPLLMTLSAANQLMSLRQLKADMKPLRDWWPDGAAPYLLGGFVGVPLGLTILQELPASQLMAIFGGFLVIYAAYSLLQPEKLQRGVAPFVNPPMHTPVNRGWLMPSLVGATGGVIGGFTAFPGAAVVIWSGLCRLSKSESRAIVQPYILGLQVLSLGILAVKHPETFSSTYWRLLALMLPVVLPGTLLGVNLYKSLSDHNFRRITFMLLGTSGLGLVAKAAGALA